VVSLNQRGGLRLRTEPQPFAGGERAVEGGGPERGGLAAGLVKDGQTLEADSRE
jgi:hypothetical protein